MSTIVAVAFIAIVLAIWTLGAIIAIKRATVAIGMALLNAISRAAAHDR